MRHIGIDYRPALWNQAGIARYVRESVRALMEIDHENRYSLYAYFWKADAVAPPPMPARFTLHRRRVPGRLIRALERCTGHTIERVLGKVEVAHLTDYIYPRVRTTTPLIITLYDLSFEHDIEYHGQEGAATLRERVHAIVPRAQRILTISEASRRDIIERYGVAEDRIRVAPPGIDHVLVGGEASGVLPRGVPSEYVLTVGTLEPRKNHLRLLEAHARLPDAPPLVIAGARGWLDDEIVRAIEAGEREGRVRWLQGVDEATLRALYAGARLFVYPSLDEGFGLPAVEALAFGCPVLTSDRPALIEATGHHASHVDPRSVDAIEAGLASALTKASDAATRDAGREWARQFTWRRCAETLREVYEELSGG